MRDAATDQVLRCGPLLAAFMAVTKLMRVRMSTSLLNQEQVHWSAHEVLSAALQR